MVRPYAEQSRPSSAAVGLISPRSRRERVDRLTPVRPDSSSRDHPNSPRSSASRPASRVSISVLLPMTERISRIRDVAGRPGAGGRRAAAVGMY